MTLIYIRDGFQHSVKIIDGYTISKEAQRTKDPNYDNMICLLCKEPDEEELIEYYINPNINTDTVWWHNRYFGGTFDQRLKACQPGEQFNYQKPSYLYRRMTQDEITNVVINKVYNWEY